MLSSDDEMRGTCLRRRRRARAPMSRSPLRKATTAPTCRQHLLTACCRPSWPPRMARSPTRKTRLDDRGLSADLAAQPRQGGRPRRAAGPEAHGSRRRVRPAARARACEVNRSKAACRVRQGTRGCDAQGPRRRKVARLATPPASTATKAPEMKAWTPAELQTFLAATEEHHHTPPIRLVAMTGLPRGGSPACDGAMWISMRGRSRVGRRS